MGGKPHGVSWSEPDIHAVVIAAVGPSVAAINLRCSLTGQLGSSGLEEG